MRQLRASLFACLIVCLSAGRAWSEAGSAKLPNIVVIMADDLGYADVGFHGGPWQTPQLDRLAKAGVQLTAHYSLPVCSPTRSSLLSGRFNSRFNCTNPTNDRVYPFETVTLASGLKSVGYHTALVGKWHLGSKLEWGPTKFGFEHSFGSLAGGVTSYAPHVYKTGEFSRTWHRNGEFVEEQGHVTDLLTQEACRFLEMKRAGPFFLYVPYTAVHLPIDEPKEWQALYAHEKDPARKLYGACVSHLDSGIGKIVETLKKQGQWENTLLVFLTDNGATQGTENYDTKYAGTHPSFKIPGQNQPWRGAKGSLYEGGIRTPALVHWAGKIQPGTTFDTPVHVADWFPTLAHLAGYTPKQDLKWDGKNIWPWLTGQAQPTSRPLYWLGPGGNSTALQMDRFVLLTQKNKPIELYDLSKDPGQKTNLAEQLPDKVRALQALQAEVAKLDRDAEVKK